MTLVELLVVSGLLLLMFGLIVAALLPGFRAWVKGDRKSDTQQNALVVVSRITQEYQNGHQQSLYVRTIYATDPEGKTVNHDAVTFLSCVDDYGHIKLTDSGDPIWQRRLVFYHDGDQQQLRSIVIPLPSPNPQPSPLILNNYSPSPTDRVVARHVRSLELAVLRPATLYINVDIRIDDRREFESELISTVTPILNTLARAVPSPSPTPRH